MAESGAGYCLHVIRGESGRLHRLPARGTVTVGRAASAGIRIEDPTAAERHALLRVNGRLTVEDLGTPGGTRLGGWPLEPLRPTELVPGAVLCIGDTLLVVQLVAGRNDAPPAPPPGPALGSRELEAVARAQRGHSNKVIAYEMGISASTVGVLLHRAARKLGTRSRRELLEAALDLPHEEA